MGGVLAKCLAEADVSKINTLKDNVFWLEKGCAKQYFYV